MTIKKIALAVVIAGSIAGSASAAPILGGVSFGGIGGWTPVGGTIATATGFNLTLPNVSFPAGNFFVGSATGDFSPVAFLIGTMQDLPNVAVGPYPIAGFWQVGGFSFQLSTASINTQNSMTLGINGTGIVSCASCGLDPTFGVWSWSGDSTGTTFGFSSSTSTVVPEPVSMTLVGLGLIAAGGMVRRRRTA